MKNHKVIYLVKVQRFKFSRYKFFGEFLSRSGLSSLSLSLATFPDRSRNVDPTHNEVYASYYKQKSFSRYANRKLDSTVEAARRIERLSYKKSNCRSNLTSGDVELPSQYTVAADTKLKHLSNVESFSFCVVNPTT